MIQISKIGIIRRAIKMKPIEKIRQLFMSLCLHPFDKNITLGQRILYIFLGLTVFIANVFGLLGSTIYVLELISIDLEDAFFGLFQLNGYLGVSYATVSIFLQRNSIRRIFQSLNDIYRKCTIQTFVLMFLSFIKENTFWIICTLQMKIKNRSDF